MGKKSRIAAAVAAAAARNTLLIQNLKTVNEAAEFKKQIEQLQSDLTSMAADQEISNEIERDVMALVLSSSLGAANTRIMAEMADAQEKERMLTMKTEAALAELNAAEMRLISLLKENDAKKMRLISLVKEKDEKNKELEDLKESLRSMQEVSERGKGWRKWLFPSCYCCVHSWDCFTDRPQGLGVVWEGAF